MFAKVVLFLANNPYNIDAKDIGVPTSTGDVGAGLTNVVKLLMTLIGMLAVIFIIVGGLQLIYSTGDAARVKRARETLIYASVGLIVAIMALAIVTFVTNGVK